MCYISILGLFCVVWYVVFGGVVVCWFDSVGLVLCGKSNVVGLVVCVRFVFVALLLLWAVVAFLWSFVLEFGVCFCLCGCHNPRDKLRCMSIFYLVF